MTGFSWADYAEIRVEHDDCGDQSPPLPTLDAAAEWAAAHVCPDS